MFTDLKRLKSALVFSLVTTQQNLKLTAKNSLGNTQARGIKQPVSGGLVDQRKNQERHKKIPGSKGR